MATYLNHRVGATATTTDGTQTTCGSYTLADETVVLITARVVGRTTAGVAGTYIRTVGVQREAAGSAALVGAISATLTHTGEDAGATTWDVTITVSGNNVLVRVTGAAATTITWLSSIEVTVLTP